MSRDAFERLMHMANRAGIAALVIIVLYVADKIHTMHVEGLAAFASLRAAIVELTHKIEVRDALEYARAERERAERADARGRRNEP